MCEKCFYKGLPARIYRTWASIITQIHAGYVAESVFGKNTVTMSCEFDHKGADFQVRYKKNFKLPSQEKISWQGGSPRKTEVKKPIAGRIYRHQI